MNKKRNITLVASVFVGVLLLVLALTNLTAIKDQIQKLPYFRPTPTPTTKYSFHNVPPPLPTGKQTYNVSHGGNTQPNIGQVTIDNYDPKKGEKQTYSIKVSDEIPVTKVQLTLTTDYKTKTYQATPEKSETSNEIWDVEVPVEDSHDYVYRVMIEAFDAKNNTSITISIR